jgi:transcriptional regulator with PAS, ATPase and Fis domain
LEEIRALKGYRGVYTHEVKEKDLTLEKAIRRHIEKLKFTNGNRSKTAKTFCISVTTLISKMKKLRYFLIFTIF